MSSLIVRGFFKTSIWLLIKSYTIFIHPSKFILYSSIPAIFSIKYGCKISFFILYNFLPSTLIKSFFLISFFHLVDSLLIVLPKILIDERIPDWLRFIRKKSTNFFNVLKSFLL